MHLTDPQTLNRYAYSRNNPLSLSDPSGTDPCDWDPSCGGGFGGDIWGEQLPWGGPSVPDWQTILFGPPDPSRLIISDNWGVPYGSSSAEGSPNSAAAASDNCPAEKRRFFDWLDEPLGSMADDLNVPESLLLTEAVKEGGWTAKALNHNQPLNNPFGVNDMCGKKPCGNHNYKSLDEAINSWENQFGERVQGVDTAADFVNGLEHPKYGEPYNSNIPAYTEVYKEDYGYLTDYMKRCGIND
jgi:hypothetical protein